MRIALRTSGGRGEYELTGSQGHFNAPDLYDHELVLELTPGSRIETNNYPRSTQGKPRIRLGSVTGGERGQHAYQTVASCLLLAKPKRALGDTNSGRLQLIDDGYSITSIFLDVEDKSLDSVVVRPSHIIASNAGGDQARIDIPERMSSVADLWNAAEKEQSSKLRSYVLAHRIAYESGEARDIIKSADALRRTIDSDEDPLKQLLRRFGISGDQTVILGVHRGFVDSSISDDDDRGEHEVAQDLVRKWRLQASRGAAGEKFRREVKEAYDDTCLFTGYRLPKTPYTQSSGVDAAHILPWATHNINRVSNGICLNKLCHWAFDSGILKLEYVNASQKYLLSIRATALDAEQNGLIDLTAFKGLVGFIPEARLPPKQSQRPDPDYLAQFNQVADK